MSNDANSCIRDVHGFSLVYWQSKPHVYQLVITRSRDLCQLLMQEVLISCYAAKLGVRKTMWALLVWVWWPNLALDIEHFVAGCAICKCTKDINMQPATLLRPLPVPSGKFH